MSINMKTFKTDDSFFNRLKQLLFLTPIKSEIIWAFISVVLLVIFLLVPSFFNQTQFLFEINGVILLIFMAALFDYIRELLLISQEITIIQHLMAIFKGISPKEIRKRIMENHWEDVENQGVVVQVMQSFKNLIDCPDELVKNIFKTSRYPHKNTYYFENSVIFIGMSGSLIHLSIDNVNEPFSCAMFGIFAYLAIVFLKNVFVRYCNIYQMNFNKFYAKILAPVLFEKPEQIELQDITENIEVTSIQLKNTTDLLDQLIQKISHNEELYQSLGNMLLENVGQLTDNQQNINKYFDKFAESTQRFIDHSKAVEAIQTKNAQNFEDFVETLSEVKSLQDSFNEGIYQVSGSIQSKVINKADKILSESKRLTRQREVKMDDTLNRMDQFIEALDKNDQDEEERLAKQQREIQINETLNRMDNFLSQIKRINWNVIDKLTQVTTNTSLKKRTYDF